MEQSPLRNEGGGYSQEALDIDRDISLFMDKVFKKFPKVHPDNIETLAHSAISCACASENIERRSKEYNAKKQERTELTPEEIAE